jgi:hypothetical protein
MNGHGHFKWSVTFNGTTADITNFCDQREWCWEQWGPSREYEFWIRTPEDKRNPAYCWIVDKWTIRLYLGSDKEAQWFGLKWI